MRTAAKKLVKRAVRGESLEYLVSAEGYVDLQARSKALVYLSPSNRYQGQDEGFRPEAFDSAFADLLYAEERALRNSAVDWLASSAWGTLVLNTNSSFWTGFARPPDGMNRGAYVSILRSTARFWEDFVALGPRFADSGTLGHFHEASPGSFSLLHASGVELPRERDLARTPELMAASNIVDRLERDDDLWLRISRPDPNEFPDLSPDNIEAVDAVCRNGSTESRNWAFLRQQRGAAAVEAAVASIVARGDWDQLMGVYVHGLEDWTRAARLLLEKLDSNEDINWARDDLVDELAKAGDPVLAAELLFQEADQGLDFATPNVYRASANRMREARDLLGDAHREVWQAKIQAFRKAHSDKKQLLGFLAKLCL